MTLGGVYAGGVLFYDADDVDSTVLKYIAGRQTVNHDTKDEAGNEVSPSISDTIHL